MIDFNVNYKKFIFYLEKVKVKIWVEKYLRLCLVYKYEIFNEKGEFVIIGFIELICIKEDIFKFIWLDRYFLDWYEVYSKV